MEQKKAEELVRRLAAALRGTELYSPTHPLVQRGIDAFTATAQEGLNGTPTVIIGFIGDEVVVDGTRLPRGTASLIGFARDLGPRDREDHAVAGAVARGSGRPRRRVHRPQLADPAARAAAHTRRPQRHARPH